MTTAGASVIRDSPNVQTPELPAVLGVAGRRGTARAGGSSATGRACQGSGAVPGRSRPAVGPGSNRRVVRREAIGSVGGGLGHGLGVLSKKVQSGGIKVRPQAILAHLARIGGAGSGVGLRIGLRFAKDRAGSPSGSTPPEPASDRRFPRGRTSYQRDTTMNRRIMFAAWAALGLVVPSLAPAQDKASSEKWVSLFDRQDSGRLDDRRRDGRDLEGRGRHDPRLGAGLAPFQPPGRTNKNFKYKAEVKIADKANSGMYFRDQEDGRLPTVTRPRSTVLTVTPSRPARSITTSKVFEMLVPPRHLVHPGDRGRGQPHHHQGEWQDNRG